MNFFKWINVCNYTCGILPVQSYIGITAICVLYFYNFEIRRNTSNACIVCWSLGVLLMTVILILCCFETWLLFLWGHLNMCVRVFPYNLNFLWGFGIVDYIHRIHHQDCCQQRSNLDVCRDDTAYFHNILNVYFEWIWLGMIEFSINIIGVPFRLWLLRTVLSVHFTFCILH